ncbi:MAG TPA: hypothetical protein VJN22_03620 [Candidatus Eremiobacteraceae bacterium]|nr:hypothetical protein [Candidatus Eremiobacteraceae bacterium]
MLHDVRLRLVLGSAVAVVLASLIGGCSNGLRSVAALPRSQGDGGQSHGGGQFDGITPSLTSTEFFAGITPGGAPRGITLGFGGMLFTERNADKIARISQNGNVKEFSGLPSGTAPNNIVQGSDGNYWFTEGPDQIGRMTGRGKFKQFVVGNEQYGPFDITAGSDNNLWFTFRSPSFNAIGRITTAGAVTLFTSGLSQSDPAVHDITNGPDGNVWFTEEFGNRIGRITPSGVISEFSVGISPNAGLVDITSGPDGNLWFTENAIDRVGRITPSGVVTEFFSGITPGSAPGSICSARGSLWFTEIGAGRIARVTTSGTVTEFPVPAALSADIAVGPLPHDLWITDFNGNGIVRVR